MKSAVFKAICFTSAVLILLAAVGILATVYDRQEEERLKALEREIAYIEEGYHAAGIGYLEKIADASPSRITLISPDGQVLYESNASAQEMENHADRPEIVNAFQSGEGRAIRTSETLGKSTYYLAKRTQDGNVLRISMTEWRLMSMIDRSATVIAIILVLCVALAALVARQLTAAVVAPINKLDLDNPLGNDTYEEFSALLLRLDRQNKRIEEQMDELKAKQQEFVLITENMEEAFVVFSAEQRVLSANRAAQRLLGRYDLKDLYRGEIAFDDPLTVVLDDAFGGKASMIDYMNKERFYRVSVHPVATGEAFAVVLFANDVTDKAHAEQMRREFTANVSHELKTPLTTIMGCSEIMATGIAKPEDHEALSHQIYKEAARLLTLIEDIIKLSKLDEGQLKEVFVEVDLYSEAERVVGELRQKAEKRQVSLYLQGEPTTVYGIPTTLHEMIYNLCDNAIIYNRPGGKVQVVVEKQEKTVLLKVIDDGIGIEKSQQSRVFERFYRVDKSRSKESGGTGLGLSIVKHGALLHLAEIDLESTPGKGTAITISFQQEQK